MFAQEIEHDHPGVTYHRVSAVSASRAGSTSSGSPSAPWLTRSGFDVVHSTRTPGMARSRPCIEAVPASACSKVIAAVGGVPRLEILTSPRLIAYWLLEAARFRSQPQRQIVASSEKMEIAGYPYVRHDADPSADLPAGPRDRG